MWSGSQSTCHLNAHYAPCQPPDAPTSPNCMPLPMPPDTPTPPASPWHPYTPCWPPDTSLMPLHPTGPWSPYTPCWPPAPLPQEQESSFLSSPLCNWLSSQVHAVYNIPYVVVKSTSAVLWSSANFCNISQNMHSKGPVASQYWKTN